MSSIAVTASATGTGVVSLVAPVTNTNQTLTLPDATGTVATTESTLTQFNASGSAPVYACRAWVNFNGTGTVAIRASGNVSSITDNGTGDYTVNFATAMPDANYAFAGMAKETSGQIATVHQARPVDPAIGSFRIAVWTQAPSAANIDSTYICAEFFR